MLSLNPGKQRSYIVAIPLLLAAAFIVAVNSDCGVPPRFNFAELKEEYRNQNKFAAGNKVEYNCRPGYSKVQRSTLQCMKYSQWSDAGEFCKARSCRHPGEPENGRLVILTDLTFGATVNFVCEEGYRLIGNAERKCVLEGSQVIWDKDIPYCQVIPCKPPPEIEHGTHTGTTMEEFNYGTSVTYQCNTVERGQVPFSLIGEPSIHCTSTDNINGDWSGPAPECKVVRCEQPRVDHGKQMTGYSPVYIYRASVLFECDHRYTLKGSNVLQCNENSRWDPQLPVCERSSCDDPPYIRNSFQDHSNGNLFPAGTVVKYNCVRGYELIPGISASVTCQKDFTWSEHQEFCQKIRCPSPIIPNGRAIPGKATYEYEEKIRIECNPGYALKDKNGSIKCESDRAWYPPLPICEPVCEPPASIFNGRINSGRKNDFFVGSRVSYVCNHGWSLVGVSSIRCIAGDGGTPRWNAPAPECKACEPPASISNGRINSGWKNDFLVGSSVSYVCNHGWSLVGVSSIRCIAGDGEIPRWNAPVPKCKEIRCPSPIIPNGRAIPGKATYEYEEKIRIECNPGYALKDKNGSIKCESDRAWHPRLPICEPACEPPARISNGWDDRVWKNDFFVGSRVSYVCNHGWSLVGVSSIRCIAGDGGTPRWHAPAPECKEILRCPNPVIEHGKPISISETEYTNGNRVEFQCESGYILKGSESIECQANGTWDPPVPSCIEVWCPKPDVQNGRMVNVLDEKECYNVNENITFKCSPGYQFSDHWYQSTTDSLNITCSADGTWKGLHKCEKQIMSPLCKMVREIVKFLHCSISLTELRTRLEEQKLCLEIQKFKRDLEKYKE